MNLRIAETLDQTLTRYKEASPPPTAARVVLRTLIAGIPYAGGSMLELFDGVAHQRVQDRLIKVLEELKRCMEGVAEQSIDRQFFDSDEFQTLFFLVLEKLQTTHSEDKIKALASALSNSAKVDFERDDKEQFLRILGDLSVSDLLVLKDPKLRGWLPHLSVIEYESEVLSSLHRLQGMGLVYGMVKPLHDTRGVTGSGQLDAEMALVELSRPAKRSFHLSEFGERFLLFVSDAGARPDNA